MCPSRMMSSSASSSASPVVYRMEALRLAGLNACDGMLKCNRRESGRGAPASSSFSLQPAVAASHHGTVAHPGFS